TRQDPTGTHTAPADAPPHRGRGRRPHRPSRGRRRCMSTAPPVNGQAFDPKAFTWRVVTPQKPCFVCRAGGECQGEARCRHRLCRSAPYSTIATPAWGPPSAAVHRFEAEDAIKVAASDLPPPAAAPAPRPDRGDVLDRARRYLDRCPPAISGQNGHGTTF